MSSLLHQFIVRTIREERTLEPEAFEVTVPVAVSDDPDLQLTTARTKQRKAK